MELQDLTKDDLSNRILNLRKKVINLTNKLKKKELFINALYANGIDNWEGWDDSVNLYGEWSNTKGE